MSFTEDDYAKAADTLKLPVATIKAVADVESSGTTHWANGQVPILFEALWFHKLTGGRYDDTHPRISSPVWDQSLYIGGPPEYGRLAEARALNNDAALESCSWGAFQIMGFNYKPLMYLTIQNFVDSMQTDGGQLEGFIRYVQTNILVTDLRNKDWDGFAEGYNGSGQVAVYAARIEEAYEHYASGGGPRALRQGDRGVDVMALQQALGIFADGDFGPETTKAVIAYQTGHALQPDGIVGVATKASLHLL